MRKYAPAIIATPFLLWACAGEADQASRDREQMLVGDLGAIIDATERYTIDYGKRPPAIDSIPVELSPGVAFGPYTSTANGYFVGVRSDGGECTAFVVPGTPTPLAEVHCDGDGDGEFTTRWLVP